MYHQIHTHLCIRHRVQTSLLVYTLVFRVYLQIRYILVFRVFLRITYNLVVQSYTFYVHFGFQGYLQIRYTLVFWLYLRIRYILVFRDYLQQRYIFGERHMSQIRTFCAQVVCVRLSCCDVDVDGHGPSIAMAKLRACVTPRANKLG
jgi:hypothetical protein